MTSSAVNTSPLTAVHTATRPASVPWLPPFPWLSTKSSWLPERGPCPAIITPSMGQHADTLGGGTPGELICSELSLPLRTEFIIIVIFFLLLLIYQEKLVFIFSFRKYYFYKNWLVKSVKMDLKRYCFSASLFPIRSAAPTFWSDPVICQASPGSADMVSWRRWCTQGKAENCGWDCMYGFSLAGDLGWGFLSILSWLDLGDVQR